MYLEDYYFCRTQTQMHGRFHQKALSNTDLPKGITKTPPTQLQQGKTPSGHTLRPAQSPPCEVGGHRSQPRGGRSLASTAHPLLRVVVAWNHVEVVETRFHTKISFITASRSCINRGVPPSTWHNTQGKEHTSLELEQHSKGLRP
jgi:hypothetical protein